MNYKVKKGDTLSKIAKVHNMSLSELMKINGISKEQADKLQIGQSLKIKSQPTLQPKNYLTSSTAVFPRTVWPNTPPVGKTPIPYKDIAAEQQYLRDNAKAIQEQLIEAKFNVGKWGADGIWGKASQTALEKAKANGYRLVKGKLVKGKLVKPESPKQSFLGEMKTFFSEPVRADDVATEANTEKTPKNTINYRRQPNQVLRKKPAIINDQAIEHCAQYGNCILRDKGYISNGHAWTRHGNQKTIYSGYNVANRPQTYDRNAVVKYNSEAADNVVRDFDFNTLDKNSTYTVGMYYKGSGAQEQAYNEGIDGVANTHTGNLFWNPETNSWVVEHNIHKTAYTNELRDVLGSRGTYGITGIYKPYKANGLGHLAAFISGLNI